MSGILVALVAAAVIIAVAMSRKRSTEGPDRGVREETIRIGGIAHTAHVNEDMRAFAYDSTGHGHFVHVKLDDGKLVSNDPLDGDDVFGPASPDERWEWERFFGRVGL